jgi:hypothetical protein
MNLRHPRAGFLEAPLQVVTMVHLEIMGSQYMLIRSKWDAPAPRSQRAGKATVDWSVDRYKSKYSPLLEIGEGIVTVAQ